MQMRAMRGRIGSLQSNRQKSRRGRAAHDRQRSADLQGVKQDVMKHYPHHLDLQPALQAKGVVQLPGSKSISNRILLLAALASGTTRIMDLLASDDTHVMLMALQKLGVKWEQIGESSNYIVHGTNNTNPVHQAGRGGGGAGAAGRPGAAGRAGRGGGERGQGGA